MKDGMENALLGAHRNALGERPCRTRGIHVCRETVEGVTVFRGSVGKRPALEVGRGCPTGVGPVPITNVALSKGFVLRVAKKMADALPTA